MDLLSRISLGAMFAVLILPAWIVFRLQNPKVSVPIGGLIFWGWLVLLSGFIRDFDPSYDGWGPFFNLLFGLPLGIGYCAFWAVICRLVLRLKVNRSRGIISLVVWSAMIILCVCFPFLVTSTYHRSLMFYMPYLLFGVGPILLLSVAMVLSILFEMHRSKGCVLTNEDANIVVQFDAAPRRD